eukprot:sb/3463955/
MVQQDQYPTLFQANIEIKKDDISWSTSSGSISTDSFTFDSSTNNTVLSLSSVPTSDTNYTCTHSMGVSSTAPLKVIDFTTSPQTTPILGSMKLSCVLPSSTPYTPKLQWYKDGTALGSEVQTTNLEREVTDAGVYWCRAEYATATGFNGGNVDSSSATISIIDFRLKPTGTTVLKGQTTVLTCGIENLSYEAKINWYDSDGDLEQEGNKTYSNNEYNSEFTVTEGGTYNCTAIYTASGAFQGGSISTTASVNVIDISASEIFATPNSNVTLKCGLKGLTEVPAVFSLTQDGSSITEEVIKTNLLDGTMNLTATIVDVKSDSSYTCVVGWDVGNNVEKVINLDVVGVTTSEAHYGVVDQSTVLTCNVSSIKDSPDETYWQYKGKKITAETEEYLPKLMDDGNGGVIYTLQVKKVTEEGDYKCVFQFKSGTSGEFELSEETELKLSITSLPLASYLSQHHIPPFSPVIYGYGGAALQFSPALSTVKCELVNADEEPTNVYWMVRTGDRNVNN